MAQWQLAKNFSWWCFLILSVRSILSLPCVPGAGKTYLSIGQDYNSISNYSTSLGIPPHVVMSYASLTNLSLTLTSLAIPSDYGSGIQWSSGLLSLFPNASLQLGLWVVGLTESINSGKLDIDIVALANYLKNLDRPIFLRIGYEFDSSNNHYNPLSYQKAFQHIVTKFRDLSVTNVAYVWHATGEEPRAGLAINSWFPGVEYVDWCGISFFQQPYTCQIPTKCEFDYAESIVSFCNRYSLPIMIAESTPFGGIIDEEGEGGGGGGDQNEAGYQGDSWNSWFIPIIEFIEKHDIKMWNYINCNWDSQQMWQHERAPNVHWGDTRIEHYPHVKEKWYHDVLNNERYSWTLAKSAFDPDHEDEDIDESTKGEDVKDIQHSPICHIIEINEIIQPNEIRAIDLFLTATGLITLSLALYFYFQHKRQNSHAYVTIH